jgi:hypothetical protein
MLVEQNYGYGNKKTYGCGNKDLGLWKQKI